MLYAVIFPASKTAPANTDAGRAYIKAGQDGDGDAATWADSVSGPTSTTTFNWPTNATGLTEGVSYRVAFVWSDGSRDSNVVVSDAFIPENVPERGGGVSKPKRRRFVVKIDDEEFVVGSMAEVEELLSQAREEAEKQAQLALERAAKSTRRPTRKVMADARKALKPPEIVVEGENDYARKFMDDIRALYQSTLDTIEIGALMRARERQLLAIERQIEDDDEDVLLLL